MQFHANKIINRLVYHGDIVENFLVMVPMSAYLFLKEFVKNEFTLQYCITLLLFFISGFITTTLLEYFFHRILLHGYDHLPDNATPSMLVNAFRRH